MSDALAVPEAVAAATSPPRRRRRRWTGTAPPLHRASAPPPWRTRMLRYSGVPRLPGLNHDSTEGRAYRAYLLGRDAADPGLLARLGLTLPLPGWACDYVRELGKLEVELVRAHWATEREEMSPTRREPEVRRLVRMEQRLRGQKLTQERMLGAIVAQHRPAPASHATDVLARLNGGA